MKIRSVPVIPPAVLSDWPTKRLLGRLAALRRLHESPELSDYSLDEVESTNEIVFKSDPRWNEAHTELKRILDTREHARRGKAARLAKRDQETS